MLLLGLLVIQVLLENKILLSGEIHTVAAIDIDICASRCAVITIYSRVNIVVGAVVVGIIWNSRGTLHIVLSLQRCMMFFFGAVLFLQMILRFL